MNQHENFTHLCQQTHALVNSYINRLVAIRADQNTATKTMLEERIKVFQFVSKLRLDFQPLFITDDVVEDLWEEIREENVVQEMVTEMTLLMLTHVQHDFHTEVAKALRFATQMLTKAQGALDADYYERIVDPTEIEPLITNNPWFAVVLLIALGRDEYVKPDFLNTL